MRKAFRFAFSNIVNFTASWMMTRCVTNPNVQGNLAWIILVHPIIKWRCENRIARDSGKSSCQKKQKEHRRNICEVTQTRHSWPCPLTLQSPRTHAPHASPSAPAARNPSGPNQVFAQGKMTAMDTSLCFLLWTCDVLSCALTTCLSYGKQTDAFMGNWRHAEFLQLLREKGWEAISEGNYPSCPVPFTSNISSAMN